MGALEHLLDQSMDDWRLADRFGWLPSQVAKESRLKIWAIDTIDRVVVEMRNDQERRNNQPHVNGNGGG